MGELPCCYIASKIGFFSGIMGPDVNQLHVLMQWGWLGSVLFNGFSESGKLQASDWSGLEKQDQCPENSWLYIVSVLTPRSTVPWGYLRSQNISPCSRNGIVSLVPTRHHPKLLQNYWLHSLCCTLPPRDYFYNCRFVLLNPLRWSLRRLYKCLIAVIHLKWT